MSLKVEYEQDFYAWAVHNAQLLRAGKLTEVDVENLAEELESLGRSEKRELVSRLAVLLAHLLKWQFQPAKRSSSWQGTISEQRQQIAELLAESPSLQYQVEQKFLKAYKLAVTLAFKDTGIPEIDFPSICPYSFERALAQDFYPD